MVSSALLLIDYLVWAPLRQTQPALQEKTESACDQNKEIKHKKGVSMITKATSRYHFQHLPRGRK